MNDDELTMYLQKLIDKLPETEAIFTAHPFLRRKTLEAIVLAKGDLTRALEIFKEWCEHDKELDTVINRIVSERFLTAWDEEGEEQH